MEKTKAKTEIIVKRLSAFKFAVEVCSGGPEANQPMRESVIRRAPPSSPTSPTSESTLVRESILFGIVEVLLWRLIGEQRLTEFCGYPHAPVCVLLRRVLQLSENYSRSKFNDVSRECDGSIACFMKEVRKLLQICAPTPFLWSKFGWTNLSEEAIFRKIYIEELAPNMRCFYLKRGTKIVSLLDEIDSLLAYEARVNNSLYPRPAMSSNFVPVLRPELAEELKKRRFSDGILNWTIRKPTEGISDEHRPRRSAPLLRGGHIPPTYLVPRRVSRFTNEEAHERELLSRQNILTRCKYRSF